MQPIVSIIGHHNSGKTRLITRVLPVLTARGLRVATAKHSPHLETIDAPGADSAQHLAAGADRVLLRGERSSALFWRHGASSLTLEVERLLGDADLVLVEGGKSLSFPKIEVFRRGSELTREPLAGEIDVAAVVTDERVPLPDEIYVFSTRDLGEISDLIEVLAFGEALSA